MTASVKLVGLLIVVTTTIAVVPGAGSALLGFPPRALQDWLDERALRSHFGIPSGFERIVYDGYPSMVGFGQREGLETSAAYRLTDNQEESFLTDAPDRGWAPLPIPAEVRLRILFRGMPVPLDADHGAFLCRTAGDNVLYADVTRPCREVNPLPDVILGVLDIDRNVLYAVVRAGY